MADHEDASYDFASPVPPKPAAHSPVPVPRKPPPGAAESAPPKPEDAERYCPYCGSPSKVVFCRGLDLC